jgi:hypothetical protein
MTKMKKAQQVTKHIPHGEKVAVSRESRQFLLSLKTEKRVADKSRRRHMQHVASILKRQP